jgi:hypothetical protein
MWVVAEGLERRRRVEREGVKSVTLVLTVNAEERINVTT